MKGMVRQFVKYIFFVSVIIIITSYAGYTALSSVNAACKICSIDMAVVISGGTPMVTLICPLAVVYGYIYVCKKYNYNTISRYSSRMWIIGESFKALIILCIIFVTEGLIINIITGYVRFGSLSNIYRYDSYMLNELGENGIILKRKITEIELVMRSYGYSIVIVMFRSLFGIAIYFLTDKGWLGILAEFIMYVFFTKGNFLFSFLVRRNQYTNIVRNNYSEIAVNEIFISNMSRDISITIILLLILIIIIRKKDFIKT